MALSDAHNDIFDEVDAILNGHGSDADDLRKASDSAQQSRTQHGTLQEPPIGVGLDEVKVQHVRKRAPKLDDTLLTSINGMPKLQKIAKSRLKFRGKGHEFSDVAWLLGTYQVWLHELYPRAKFADGLIMIEKLGHTKRMQILRSGWIDESKPKKAEENDPDHESQSLTTHPGLVADPSPRQSNLTPDTNSSPPEQEVTMDAGTNGYKNPDNFEDRGAPDDDELDQLLAEEPSSLSAHLNRNSSTSASFLKAGAGHADEGIDYADEEDIMRDLEFP